jgi:hypothetical protein
MGGGLEACAYPRLIFSYDGPRIFNIDSFADIVAHQGNVASRFPQ